MALTGRASRVPGDVAGAFNTAGFSLDSSPAIFNPECNTQDNWQPVISKTLWMLEWQLLQIVQDCLVVLWVLQEIYSEEWHQEAQASLEA